MISYLKLLMKGFAGNSRILLFEEIKFKEMLFFLYEILVKYHIKIVILILIAIVTLKHICLLLSC